MDACTEISRWAQSRSPQMALRAVLLAGDGSDRRYYRLLTLKNRSAGVVMKMAPFGQSGGDEPFLAIQRHLAQAQVEVPQIYAFAPEEGLIWLEDLGDKTLQLQCLRFPGRLMSLYQQAIDALIGLQTRASPTGHSKGDQEGLIAFRHRFDVAKLESEVDFTLEHLLVGYLKKILSPKERKKLRALWVPILEELAAQPTVLAHRDYHARNLMITPERLVLIDFQDARLGPAAYDLASLLGDAYVFLSARERRDLFNYYVGRAGGLVPGVSDASQFARSYRLASIQRGFKAMGSFAFFYNRKADAQYLRYIGNAFQRVQWLLRGMPTGDPLRQELLKVYA